ncbi:MAG TPA: MFS transporter [Burkholderiales bacterium]|nr:MFS transporter [Burkholderiales bacterium]
MTKQQSEADSAYAWVRLAAALAISTVGGVGLWSVVVVLPTVQAEFGVARGDASLPYTLTLLGLCVGGLLMGRLADRFGVVVPVVIGALALGIGYVAASTAASLWQFALVQGLVIGLLGASATFSPLLADISLWFVRRRGLAVAICASGNYLAGTIWPPLVQHFIETVGWRQTHVGIGLFCAAVLLPLAAVMRRRPPAFEFSPAGARAASGSPRPLGFSPGALQGLLIVAGLACCMAMSMPQVHIVAYCTDLGYGPARGAEMLSVMLGLGVVSRLASGWICDHIGGLRTLALGSLLQGLALMLFLPFDGLVSLYVISGLFGLFQGGIVPAYAIIVREHFTPREAATRIAAVITATLFGMALGGWMTGAIFDLTGSYRAAFANGIGWNLVNLTIALWLVRRSGGGFFPRAPAPLARAG